MSNIYQYGLKNQDLLRYDMKELNIQTNHDVFRICILRFEQDFMDKDSTCLNMFASDRVLYQIMSSNREFNCKTLP